MNRQPFETMPDVMDAKQIAEALQISKAGAYNLLNSPDFPTLRIGGRKLVMKADLMEWLKGRTNRRKEKEHEKAALACADTINLHNACRCGGERRGRT